MTYPFDFAAGLGDLESIKYFLNDALETADSEHIQEALAVTARAEGIAELALLTGLTAEQIARSFVTQNSLGSEVTLRVIKALGLGLPVIHK